MAKIQTAERVSHLDKTDTFVYVRSLKAYAHAAELIHGKVLEIGTGSGYGISLISPKCDEYVTLDKISVEIDKKKFPNVQFLQANVPPLEGLKDNYFDFVFLFQVIEHIPNDAALIKEIHRVLKPGGKVLMTTPNIKKTLFRNPWHIREYTVSELQKLVEKHFITARYSGVYAHGNALEYYIKNKASVHFVKRFDIFNLEKHLPSSLLKIPFDIGNRLNRLFLYKKTAHSTPIADADFTIEPVSDECLDLFIIGEKK